MPGGFQPGSEGLEGQQDIPYQAQGLDAHLEDAISRQSGREAAVGIEEGVRYIEGTLFPQQVGTDAGTNRFDDDKGAGEGVLLKDIDLYQDLDMVCRVRTGRVRGDGVDEVADVNCGREGLLARHGFGGRCIRQALYRVMK